MNKKLFQFFEVINRSGHWLVAKITVCLLFAAITMATAKGYAQKINLELKQARMETVFNRIEEMSGYSFIYEKNILKKISPVDVSLKNSSLEDAMNLILKGQPLEFTIRNKYIVVSLKANMASLPSDNEAGRQINITGTVKDDSGTSLPGVTIKVKGSTTSAQTNSSGQYAIVAQSGDILVFSYVGYEIKEVTIGTEHTVNVTLNSTSQVLEAVVVTALGIKRSEKSLTYSTQQVSGEELNKVKSPNLMNSLSGKIAGATISPSASGVGGSAKVILRGNRSFSGNNQPLYVIDGVPITNSAGTNGKPGSGNTDGQPNSPFGGSTNVDGGDGISNLNPNDIESISVLKGASASALYGSQAANGVILITTKKGRTGNTQVSFNSTFSTDHVAYEPEFQNTYGRSPSANNDTKDSWGEKMNGGKHDNTSEFFQNGRNWTNAINLSGGNEIAQTYFSYANTTARGIQPGNDLERHNFNLRETARFFNNKLTVDGNVNYITQKIDNTPALGFYFNPLTGLYLFPRGVDINPYKDQYEFSDKTGYARQNWVTSEDIQQNPWWIINRNPNETIRKRLLLNGSVKYEFNQWLNLQVRANLDQTSDSYEQDLYSGTQATLSKENGQFILNNQVLEQKYADVLLNFTLPVPSDFKVDGVLGASITDARRTGTALGAGNGLSTPNLFIAQNTLVNGTISNTTTLSQNHNQLQSAFANANLSYKDWVFLNLTARNDWSSNLAFTPDQSYFYPSAGLSFLLTQALHLPEAFSYAKIRVNHAEVGNTVPQYVTNPLNYLDPNTGAVVLNTVAPFGLLKPERTKVYELGTDLRFLKDRLSLNFTYYKSNTKNQFVEVSPSKATGYSKGYINAGEVQNSGLEFMLGYDIRKEGDFKWNTSINGARNINKIIDVASKDGIDRFELTGNYNTSYKSILNKGGSYGDIYGITTKKDAQGRIVVNADGTPQLNDGFNYIGNPNPKFSLGWSNDFNYKRFNLSFLVDGKFGGQVLSMTQSVMDQYGVSKTSGDARDAGGVTINGVNAEGSPVTSVDPKTWYNSIGGKQGISEQYIYSATVVRLREAALGYSFPIKGKTVKDLRLSLTGRNLFYFYKKAPYDPEVTISTGNGLSGVDIFNQPATRSIGFNLNVTF